MKQCWPAPERNKDPILGHLLPILRDVPSGGTVLEVASGTGQHAVHFAAAVPHLTWQPSDPDPENRASIDAWRAEGPTNVAPAIELDVCGAWPAGPIHAVININMIHIAPWDATPALFAGAQRLLAPARPLVLYGPFKRGQAHTAPSNAAFDASLRERDARWGVRDLEAVVEVADAAGFDHVAVHALPANNLLVHFVRRA